MAKITFPARISNNMHNNTNAELANMHFMYGVAQGNCLAAQSIYKELFPGRILPYPRTFERLHPESFYASRRDTGIVRYRRTPAVEEAVLRTVEDSPSTSLRAVGRALGVSHFLD